MSFPQIKTARIRLRCITRADAEGLAGRLTPNISQWLASWPYPTTAAMMRRRIEAVLATAAAGDSLPCVIVRRSDAEVVGWIVLTRDVGDPRRGSLGYWLCETVWGQGLAREAAAALMQTGFGRFDLDVIEAGARLGNEGSFKVMRACGMTKADVRMVHASARDRDEACLFYERARSGSSRSAS